MDIKSKYRIDGLDALKCLCAFLVVCIHKPFPGILGQYFLALTRIAVPIFFMITGYFYEETVKRNKTKRQIEKVIILCFGSNLLFFLFNGGISVLNGEFHEFIERCFNGRSLLYFVLLNDSPVQGHLWYLGALLYVLIIVNSMDIAVNKLHQKAITGGYRVLYILIPFLLIGDLILGKYSLLIFDREFPYVIVRNWLFVGLPYFLIGDLIFKLQSNIKMKGKKYKSLLLTFIFVFAVTSLLERYFLAFLGKNSIRDHYISTTFLAITLFLWFMDFNIEKENKYGKRSVLMLIGRKYSALIYIIHPIFIVIYDSVVFRIGKHSSFLYNVIAPGIVFVSALVFSIIVKEIWRMIFEQ